MKKTKTKDLLEAYETIRNKVKHPIVKYRTG